MPEKHSLQKTGAGERYLAERIVRLERMVRDLAQASQAADRSVEDGAIDVYDDDGNLQARLGRKKEDKWGAGYVGTAQPPTPSIPDVLPIPGGMLIFWDGRLEEATDIPIERVAIFASTESGFLIDLESIEDPDPDDDGAQEVGAIYSDGGGTCVIPTWGEERLYIRAVAISESGVASEPTIQIDGYSVEATIAFYVDEYLLTEAGAQDLTLTFEPLEFSEHVYWHPGGPESAGIKMQDNVTWTRIERTLTLTGLPHEAQIDDVVVCQYAYLVGEPAGNRLTALVISNDHLPGIDDGSCDGGTMFGAVQDGDAILGNTGGPWYTYYSFRWGHAIGSNPDNDDWLIYAVVSPGPGAVSGGSDAAFQADHGYEYLFPASGVLPGYSIPFIWGNDGNQVSFGQRNNWQPASGPEPGGPLGELIGVGAIYKPAWPDWDNPIHQWDTPAHLPNGDTSFIGRHEPTACSWYYGEKFWDMTGTDIDEPGGPLGGDAGAPWVVSLRWNDDNGDPQETFIDGANETGPWTVQELGFEVLDQVTLRFNDGTAVYDGVTPGFVARVDISGEDDEGFYEGHRYTLTSGGDTMVLDIKAYVDPDEV